MNPSAVVRDEVTGPGLEHLETLLDLTYTWGYQDCRADLRALYHKATHGQWLAEEVLDFSQSVDLEKFMMPEFMHPLHGSAVFARLTAPEKQQLNVELSAWTLSQFLHGEQGALLASAQLVASIPTLDGKMYGATQVVDEARHVDVYNRYLFEKVGFAYGCNPHLKTLLDLVLKDSRWDMKFLGMQIMVEGLALAAFAMMRDYSQEPLLRELTRYVMGDEARHVAFGVLALSGHYRNMSEPEVAEREDFVYEAAVLMRDRFLFQEVWEKMGMPVAECMEITRNNTSQILFRQVLFSKIVPCIKRIGLLSPRQRERFQALGILQFENARDPDAELAST